MDKYLIRKPQNLPSDLGLRQKISFYHPNYHDEIRRHYLTKGPCQPKYSIDKDAAFCFYCYLFGWQDVGKQGGGETFVTKRFKLWNLVEKLDSHVGGVNSAHSQAIKKDKHDYQVQLNAIVDCIRFLLCRGLAFRGHDKSQGSSDKENFLEFVQFLGDHNESINEVLQTAPKNCKLTHSEIQKDIVNTIASETSKAIIKDLDNGFFSILVDESRDISVKKQMFLVLRYVNKKGTIIERFLGIVHVASTTALSLKCAIEFLLCEHNLSLSNLRGQGYDGASNMQGDINGFKTLILKENKSAFYVHCFAHQLQLTLVAVAKNHINITEFFYVRRDALRDAQFAEIKEDLENGTNLKRPGDTRWGSYYRTILNLILMFSIVVDVLEIIEEDGLSDQKVDARFIIRSILSFEFVFALHLMKNILGITNELLQVMREDEWESLLTELNNRFSEANTDLLLCMACLNPSNSFVAFDKEKLIRLAKFYPSNFLGTNILALDSQLPNYIFDMRSNDFFLELQGVSELAEKLLVLTLLVVTATVERSFSAMKYIKNELCNRMGDRWMNDCLIVYIEKDVACSIDNETIMQRFQNMKTRRRQL
ncbi:hypothetical protein RGQ29_021158 [Quercus rubra]|uniref:TTF-type domain-containing protein n=1 Tax=Quercus rubra TaxID=3512 RepID=A0AAN7FE19_QUERU|nr:hypothetical protein RGQ29_021158 [Quercus rubra]